MIRRLSVLVAAVGLGALLAFMQHDAGTGVSDDANPVSTGEPDEHRLPAKSGSSESPFEASPSLPARPAEGTVSPADAVRRSMFIDPDDPPPRVSGGPIQNIGEFIDPDEATVGESGRVMNRGDVPRRR